MGLTQRMDHRPDQLSGGEMQRVAIARALVTDPLLILADEPTGNLDSKTGTIVLDLLSKLSHEMGHTILMVTHDQRAAGFSDRMVTLRDGLLESDELLKMTHHKATLAPAHKNIAPEQIPVTVPSMPLIWGEQPVG
jgi:putative ABC transport system ATP-binding protein